MKGVFLDFATIYYNDLNLAPLESIIPECDYHATTAPSQVIARSKHAEVIITSKVVIDAAIMQQLPKLKLICIAATGTNNVDLDAAKQHNIAVCNVSSYATQSVVQHTFALILALTTKLVDYHNTIMQGAWQRSATFCLTNFPITELDGKTIGIIGYGEIGKAVAKVAAAFGMQVLVAARGRSNQPAAGRVILPELLPQVDVLSIHCPLTAETLGLIGAAELKLLPSHAFIINTARGGVVDEAALVAALKRGEIAGAGFDVLTEEPPPAAHPFFVNAVPNLILTPHTAWASFTARQRLIEMLAENIAAFGNKQNLNRVV